MPFAVNGGVSINYRVEGDGEPLVLMHGLSDSLESWYEAGYVAGLAGYRLILLDARGHGGSDKPHDPAAYSPAAMVSDVLSVLDVCGVARTHFFGHSMGGMIGLQTAKLSAGRLLSLAVGSAYPDGMPVEIGQQLFTAVTLGAESFVEQWEILAPISEELRQRLLRNDMDALRAFMTNPDALPLDDVPSTFRPLLLIMGDQDWMYPAASSRRAELDDGAFVALPDLNHLEAFQRSDLVLPVLHRFLTEVDRTAGSASKTPGP